MVVLMSQDKRQHCFRRFEDIPGIERNDFSLRLDPPVELDRPVAGFFETDSIER